MRFPVRRWNRLCEPKKVYDPENFPITWRRRQAPDSPDISDGMVKLHLTARGNQRIAKPSHQLMLRIYVMRPSASQRRVLQNQ
jgi:hypothetical protein